MIRLISLVLIIAISFGLALTGWGLVNLSWPTSLPWSGGWALTQFLCILFGSAVLIYFASRKGMKNPYVVWAVLMTFIAVITVNSWPLFCVLWIFTASFLLGKNILRILKLEEFNSDPVFSMLTGLGIYATYTGIFAHFPINYPSLYIVITAAPCIIWYRQIFDEYKKLYCYTNISCRKINILDIAIASIASIYFVVALMPELGFDALAMHLFIPVNLFFNHKWNYDVQTYVWAVMPMLADWIFSWGYMLGGEICSRLLNFGFIILIAFLIKSICLWAGGTKNGAKWAILLYISTPLTFAVGSTLFIEPVWSAFLMAGIYLILKTTFDGHGGGSVIRFAGLLLGFALASKAITLSILPILLAILLIGYKCWLKYKNAKNIVYGLLIFIAVGCIPYVNALQLTGNPLFPFFNDIFKSPFYPSVGFDSLVAFFGRGLYFDTFYKLAFQSGKYFEATPGASGFQWLTLSLPTLIFLGYTRDKKGLTILLLSLLIVMSIFHSVSYLRYAFVAWAVLAIVIGLAVDRANHLSKKIQLCLLLSIIITTSLNLAFLTSGAFYRDFSLKSIVDSSNEDRFIISRLPIRKAVKLINELNVSGNPVAVFGNPLAAGLAADALYPNWYSGKFQAEISQAETAQQLVNALLARKVEYIILESGWSSSGCCGDGSKKQSLIEDISENISNIGSINIRKIKDEFRFKYELLLNPNFLEITGWNLSEAAKYNPKTRVILSSLESPVTQVVQILPGQKYRNTVTARCSNSRETKGRIQINWLDSEGKFLDASIKIFECTQDWVEHSMVVAAPNGATSGVVYIVGNTAIPIEFSGNSLLR